MTTDQVLAEVVATEIGNEEAEAERREQAWLARAAQGGLFVRTKGSVPEEGNHA